MNKLILLGLGLVLLVSCKETEEKQIEKAPVIEVVSNIDIVDGIYKSFASGEIEAFMAQLDPKVEWNEAENFPYADKSPYIGPDALMEGVLAPIGEDWENWSVVDLELHDMKNDKVLATGRYQGKFKKNGKTINAQVAHLWYLKDSKVVKFQQYVDTKQVAEAMVE